MQLRRVKIEHYRALKNIDLSFDPAFDKQIFPLGSQNGGGKSTLLQLIFALLHCAGVPERHGYLRNLMESFIHPEDEAEKLVAELTLSFADRAIDVRFVSLGPRFLDGVFDESENKADWGVFSALKKTGEKISELRDGQRDVRARISEIEESASRKERSALERQIRRWSDEFERIEELLKHHAADSARLKGARERIGHLLKAKNHLMITDYSSHASNPRQRARALVAHSNELDYKEVEECLLDTERSIFLLGPSTQQYLFLPRLPRRTFVESGGANDEVLEQEHPHGMFRRIDSATEKPAVLYAREISSAEEKLSGFVAYDWLSVEPLIQMFRKARDEDFAEAVKTESYGNRYTSMLAEVNNLLYGKKVRPKADLSGIEFTLVTPDGEESAIGLEDLSRGELKRIMIYAWLIANQDEGALVLIDELETSFHPDWQVGIVRDLWDWAPQNQYILATHSYEVCSALTPAQVCELEPRLTPEAEVDVEATPDGEPETPS